jgi:hypothetical protein
MNSGTLAGLHPRNDREEPTVKKDRANALTSDSGLQLVIEQ